MKINFTTLGEQNPFTGPNTHIKVSNKYIGLIIGKNGETVRNLYQKTGCLVFIPKESKEGEDFRILELSGTEESIKECKSDIESLIENANKVTEALYQSIDFNYLSRQSTQTIPKNEINNREESHITSTYPNNDTLTKINNSNHLINQTNPQIGTHLYSLKFYPNNNLNAMTARSNMPCIQLNNSVFPQYMAMNPYRINNYNMNSFSHPLQTGLPMPVIQHMSINNFPTTNFINFSNNFPHNIINLQTAPTSNNLSSSSKKEQNIESNNIDDKNIAKSNQNQSDNKNKKDEMSKKSTSGILNYIYGGQVK